jgi:oligoribonuclease NrnB/cAMP/cGMP phosphodiesterase (DHH superfamily)
MTTPILPKPSDILLFHLSHIDLDGYGAQYMTRAAGYRARYYNADYRDIPYALDQIFDDMSKAKEPCMLLITDLNLTLEQSDMVAQRIQNLGKGSPSSSKKTGKAPAKTSLLSPEMAAMLKGALTASSDEPEAEPIKPLLQLLDHHATGEDSAKKYDWYYLDTERCATRLAFEAIAPYLGDDQRALYASRAEFVDVGDRWLKDDPRFNRAIYLIGLIMEDDQLAPPLVELKRDYRFHMMESFFQLMEQGATLEELERGVYDYRKAFLRERIASDLCENPENTLKEKFHRLAADAVLPEDIPMLRIDSYRTGIFFNWPHDVFRGVAMVLMEQRKQMDIAIRVGGNGRMSLRANENVDVGIISGMYFEGGGHPGAAGGVLRDNRLKDVDQAMRAISMAVTEKKGLVQTCQMQPPEQIEVEPVEKA